MSQYHYTAHLRDETGAEYLLHVYFNDSDAFTRPPIFSLKNVHGEYESIPSERHHLFFNELALKSSQQVVFSLKKQWKDTCKQLHVEYKRAEEEACVLSQDLQDNLVPYRSKLNEILRVLMQ